MNNNTKKIKSYIDLFHARIAADVFYTEKGITEKLRDIPPIPLESDWCLKPYITGSYISSFRICKGKMEVSIVLEWFNQSEENPYYEVLPLGYEADYIKFGIHQVNELHDHIKSLFNNWGNKVNV